MAGDEMMMSVPASSGKVCDGCKDRMQASPSFFIFCSEKLYFHIEMNVKQRKFLIEMADVTYL